MWVKVKFSISPLFLILFLLKISDNLGRKMQNKLMVTSLLDVWMKKANGDTFNLFCVCFDEKC